MSTLPQDGLRHTVQKMMREKARAGYLLGRAPVGYLNRRRGKKSRVEIDPVKAPLVRQAFELAAEGTHSLRGLVEILSALALTSRNGKPLGMSALCRMLTNPFYYGLLHYDSDLIAGNHTPLVSRELWHRAHDALMAHHKTSRSSGEWPARHSSRDGAVSMTDTPSLIYQLYISLDDIRPAIWRRVLVPANITLPKLHHVIQTVMGWQDCHLHAFRVGEVTYAVPDPDLDDLDIQREQGIRLNEIAPGVNSRFCYEYDFGDNWRHTIVVEQILPKQDGRTYPVCTTGKRACPLEDCGGPSGYTDFLNAISDPEHSEHEKYVQWVGGAFDPEAFTLDVVNTKLSQLPV